LSQHIKTAVHRGEEPSGTSWSFGTSWSITGLPGRVVAILVAVLVAGTLAAPAQQQASAVAVADRMVENAGEIVEVIVQAVTGTAGTADAEQSVANLGGEVVQRLGIVDGIVVRIPADKVDDLSRAPGVASVTSNQRVQLLSRRARGEAIRGQATLGHVRETVGVDIANLFGVDGSGVSIGLVDTGAANVAGLPRVDRGPATAGGVSLDGYGHGTHLAGIIAGDDPGSSNGSFAGMANDARIVSVNAATDDGATNLASVLAALDFILYQKDAKNIRVVNLSLGVPAGPSYTTDLLAFAVERLWFAGIVVVVAAGNSGELAGSPLTSPATDPYVIAVGSVDTKGTGNEADDVVHAFSPAGTPARRVDVVAPGQSLVSLRAPGSVSELSYPDAHIGSRFIKGTGTSQAAAVVAGVVADLLELRPSLTPDQVKSVLTRSADPVAGAGDKDGAGMVDLLAAIAKSPASNATQTWPRATGHALTNPPPQPPAPDAPVCTWDHEQGPPPPPPQTLDPAADPTVAPACGWTGGQWSADGTTFTGGTFQAGTWTGSSWTGSSWTNGTWTGSSWTGGQWMVGTWEGSWNGSSWTGSSWTGSSWTGGEWTGSSWTGSSWTGSSWTGSSWTGSSWTVGTWNGSSWTGSSWTGSSWTGSSWTGSSWTGSSWTGGAWNGSSWTGGAWNGSSWTGSSWTGSSWTGSSWTGSSWTGSSWTGSSWTGSSWTGSSWTSDVWTGTSWS
jgi:serine protease AprX